MIEGLKPYPKYKDSLSACGHAQTGGMPWLGEVPEHWKALPLKRIAKVKSSSVFPVDEQGEQDGRYGSTSWR